MSSSTKRKLSNRNKGKHLSEETKKRISKSRKGIHVLKTSGKNHWNWKGGASFLPYSSEWTEKLRQSIKNRDNKECQNPYCNYKTKLLEIHHINYDKQDCSQFNLITLCKSCNSRANINRKEWKRFYKRIIWGKY